MVFFFSLRFNWVPERKVQWQSVGLPDVHHKGHGGFETWCWRGIDLPVKEPSELGGVILEF